MNKYEELFEDIHEKTNSDQINWRQVSRRANAELVFNPDTVFRQYRGQYTKDDERYTLVFVEKKFDDPLYDFSFQAYKPEILILDEHDDLILTLNDAIVEKSDLIDLMQSIEEKSDRAKKLLG